MTEVRQKCWIYRSSRKDEMYLYLAKKDEFEVVPEALLNLMGKVVLVMELELHPERRLARADVAQVMADLADRGFHLQLPPAHPHQDAGPRA